MSASHYLSVRQYAARYGVSANTVYAMVAAGRLPHVRLGVGRGTIRIPDDHPAGGTGAIAVPLATPPAVPPRPRRVRLHHLRPPG